MMVSSSTLWLELPVDVALSRMSSVNAQFLCLIGPKNPSETGGQPSEWKKAVPRQIRTLAKRVCINIAIFLAKSSDPIQERVEAPQIGWYCSVTQHHSSYEDLCDWADAGCAPSGLVTYVSIWEASCRREQNEIINYWLGLSAAPRGGKSSLSYDSLLRSRIERCGRSRYLRWISRNSGK